MALRCIGYVSEHNIRDTHSTTLWRRDVDGNHTSVALAHSSVRVVDSPLGLVRPIELYSIDPAALHLLHTTVDEQNTFIWWVLFISILGFILVGIIAVSAMYKICMLKPSCIEGARCTI